MKVRDAEPRDIPGILDLVERFYAEAPYEAPEVYREQGEFLLQSFLEHIPSERAFLQVMDKDGKICGVIMGERIPDLWSNAQKCLEHIIYVLPAYRGKAAAGKLLLNFGRWTELVPSVVRVEAASGIDDEATGKVFEKLGWSYRATSYGKEAY